MARVRAPRGSGVREPERPLMSAISDALQIDHFKCAKGSSVERPFLEAVAAGLGFDGTPRQFRNKDLLLAAIIEQATGSRPSQVELDGGTVTNDALRTVLQGIQANGFARVSLTDGGAAVRIATALFDENSDPAVFDPLNLSDERKRSLRQVVIREGQGSFRNLIFNAYGGRCALTGCDVPEALEAAHIRPYKGPRTNHAANGILLRADLHRLWDTGLLAVHESSHRVLFASRLVATDYALTLGGNEMRLPQKASQQPSSVALELQRTWAGL
jgi:hypothetical protein